MGIKMTGITITNCGIGIATEKGTLSLECPKCKSKNVSVSDISVTDKSVNTGNGKCNNCGFIIKHIQKGEIGC